MTAGIDRTLSAGPSAAASTDDVAPCLVIALEGARPRAGGARISLAGAGAVELGRGDDREVRRDDGEPGRVTVRIPDRLMSTRHLRLVPGLSGWDAVDAGSKNGTTVGERPIDRHPLRDGDVLVCGHTALLYRDAAPVAPAEVVAAAGDPLATLSPALGRAHAALIAVARAVVPIVIAGESGTGKEVAARAVHARSGRPGRFVAVNCAALPAGLVESALFGHRRGAFSGAVDDQLGLIRAADRGTLLLDEIGDLPLPAQGALLRVLQEREVVPVGDTRPIAVDLRVVAATHRDLEALVAGGAFRADLAARLRGHAVVLPPLRARREDLGLLVAAALDRHAAGRAVTLAADAVRAIAADPWPLNIRELDRALETALALAGDGPIAAAHLERAARPPPRDGDALRARLELLLREHRGNISAVARDLGKARMQVQRWLRRFHLDPEQYRS